MVLPTKDARTIFTSKPEGILMSPDGGLAYVAVNGDNCTAVIDFETWRMTKKISTGAGPDGMAWVP